MALNYIFRFLKKSLIKITLVMNSKGMNFKNVCTRVSVKCQCPLLCKAQKIPYIVFVKSAGQIHFSYFTYITPKCFFPYLLRKTNHRYFFIKFSNVCNNFKYFLSSVIFVFCWEGKKKIKVSF